MFSINNDNTTEAVFFSRFRSTSQHPLFPATAMPTSLFDISLLEIVEPDAGSMASIAAP
jgi:hypothetical protein